MRKLIFTLLVLSAFKLLAQEEIVTKNTLQNLQEETNQTVLHDKIAALENGTAEDLNVLIEYYDQEENDAKKDAMIERLMVKYPASEYARMRRMVSFLDITGAEAMEKHLKPMIEKYPGINLDMEKNLVAAAYAEEPNEDKVFEYINAIDDKVFRIYVVANILDIVDPIDSAMALEIADSSLKDAQNLKVENLSSTLKVDPKLAYSSFIAKYAKLLFKAGKDQQAYQYVKEALSCLNYNSSGEAENPAGLKELLEIRAFLASSLEDNYEESLPVLSQMIKEGKFEKKYIDQVRLGYASLNPDKDVEAYIDYLRKQFTDKIRSEVKGLMINEQAPDFYVTDIEGKKVTLEDFKGKTIVLDFWATWCGPCVESFPAMQLAVDRYADDPLVEFLFIHTWENVKDPLSDAQQFLKKRDYDFDLYMDTIDPETNRPPAVTAFGVVGIPAKFIIDGWGQIRFKLEGFNKSDEEAAEEVVQMVELARE
ncbi:TlpA family protein disulfide reductase [Zunongwangia pacifica]|uniref:TlpA family protein disulfide reductase n=1 Tax=Zunongwangia pacifica TaxID=2911062 RepID=A0A9X1ZZA1_9FLAO|nr:TlpA disulfide reductase family protein [Zunongwangia pacifica]MCL6220448.1 TlpA family protein disulfide reductase [Zunongwangia pacifica]